MYNEASPDTTNHGRFLLATKGGALRGLVYIAGAWQQLTGTVTGTAVAISFVAYPTVGYIAHGQISSDGSSISGTFTIPDPQGGPTHTGTWSATLCQ